MSVTRGRTRHPAVRSVICALLALMLLLLFFPAETVYAVPTVAQEKYVLPASESSTTSITLDNKVRGNSVLIVAVASSRSVSSGVLPNDLTISDTLGTTWLLPSNIGTSVQESGNAVQVFMGNPSRNDFITITLSGYPVELVDVVEVVGASLTDPLIINTGVYDGTINNIQFFGSFTNSDITGGAYGVLIAQGSGGTSAASPDPLDSNNFQLKPFTGFFQSYVATPSPLTQAINVGQTTTLTGQPPHTLWGGHELFNTLLTSNLVIDADIAGGYLVFVSVFLDPPASRSRQGPSRPNGQEVVRDDELTKATGVAAPVIPTYQWLEKAPGAPSYTNAVDLTGPTTLTPTLATTGSTILGTYFFELQMTGGGSGGTSTSSPVTVIVNPALFAQAINPLSRQIDMGQSITLTASPTGGTVPYLFQWYSGASPDRASDTNPLGTSSQQSVSPSSDTFYWYQLHDSSQGTPAAEANSPTAVVTLNQPYVVISQDWGDTSGPPGWSNVRVLGYKFPPFSNVVLYWQDLNNPLNPTTSPLTGTRISSQNIVTLSHDFTPLSWNAVPVTVPGNANWGNGYIVALVQLPNGAWMELARNPFNVRAEYVISSTTPDGVTLKVRVTFTGNPSPDGAFSSPTNTPVITLRPTEG